MAEIKDVRTYHLNVSITDSITESAIGGSETFRIPRPMVFSTNIDVHPRYFIDVIEADIIKLLAKKLDRLLEEEIFFKKHRDKYATLTRREKEILSLLGHGLNNPQIASHLFISRKTVEQHRKNINQKLAIVTFLDLVKYIQAFDIL